VLIYVGVDFIGTTVVYFGSQNATTKARIAADLAHCRLDFTMLDTVFVTRRYR
jgi:hypothetical protein